MPLQAQGGEGGHLVQALLHIVLAEGPLAGGGGLAHGVHALGLAHRQQRDALGVAAGGEAGRRHATLHFL